MIWAKIRKIDKKNDKYATKVFGSMQKNEILISDS